MVLMAICLPRVRSFQTGKAMGEAYQAFNSKMPHLNISRMLLYAVVKFGTANLTPDSSICIPGTVLFYLPNVILY